MTIPATLLLSYQQEYENTDITIQQLCEKYNVTTKQLKGYTKWKKLSDKSTDVSEPLIAKPIETVPKKKSKPQPIAKPKDINKMIDSIEEFKALAIDKAKDWIKNDADYAEVKEFKDIVNIVDTIEKSYKDDKPKGPTINIAIQNLVERFSDDI